MTAPGAGPAAVLPEGDEEPTGPSAAPAGTPGGERRGEPAPRWYRPGLVTVAVAALAVRLVNVLVWRPTCAPDLYDTVMAAGPGNRPDLGGPRAECFKVAGDVAYSYVQGRLLAQGHWFVDSYAWIVSGGAVLRPSSGDPPLFALYLGLLSRLGLSSSAAMRVVTCLVGVAGVVLLATLTRRLVGRRAALLAGAVAAVYPMLWINDGMLLSESLYVPVLLVALHAAYTFWERPEARTAMAFGATMALAALVRGEAVLFLVILPWPLLWGLRRDGVRRVLGLGALAVGTGLFVVAPWVSFNLTRFHRPALMTSATGAVLSSANCDTTYYGTSVGYYADCVSELVAQGRTVGMFPGCDEALVARIAAARASSDGSESDLSAPCRPTDPALDETDRDKFSTDLAVDYMKSHRDRLPVVVAARVGRMWDVYIPPHPDEPLGQNVFFNWYLEGRGQLASQVAVLLWWALLPTAVVGTVLLWRRGVPVSPLVAMAVVITVTAAATFGITRYRVPLDVVAVVAAMAAVDRLLGRWWPDRGGPSLGRLRGAPTTTPGGDDAP